MNCLIIAALFACAFQGGQKAPIAANPLVEINGHITKVGLNRGQGTPSLEVKADSGKTWKIWLGSMRYLVEQNFSPKAGQDVVVKGFKDPSADELTAATVTLPETKQTIRLRDDSGFPVWRGRSRGSQRPPN